MTPGDVAPAVLFVCTANICRSPMAEAILARRVEELGARARARSAGLRALGGPADGTAQRVLAARGLDLSTHESTGVGADDIADAALVLAMERAHIAAIAAGYPAAFAKTFGLTEIVELGNRHGPRREDERVEDWAARLHTGRRPEEILAADPGYDIVDPHGGTVAQYERCADRLTELIDALIGLLRLSGPAPASAAGAGH